MSQLEELVKYALMTSGFRRSWKYRSNWIHRVKDINEYWNHLMADVKLTELMDEFELACARFGVEVDPWEIVPHLKKAVTEWRIELMTIVANRIVWLQCDVDEGDFVQWNGHDMLLINMPDVPER